jgi:phosphoglycolate phosphatase-like HAD superfamily hydrolase
LDEFFDGVYGSPRSKNEILRMILAENCLPAGQAVFLGDALGDCLSARDVCMPFIGRVAKGNPVSFPGDSVMGVVENLKQLDQQWDSLVMQFSE